VTQPEGETSATGLSEGAIAAIIAATAPLILAALTRWLDKARAAILGTPKPSLTMLSALDQEWAKEVDLILPDLMRAARRGWEETATQLGMRIPFNPSDPILVEQLARTRNLLVQVDDEIYRMVIKALADATDRGESNAQISARVNNILSITGTVNWPNRSVVIAETESRRFGEAGSLSAVQRFQATTGKVMLKTWTDREDSRVRSTHRQVDGTTIPVNSLFRVGKSSLRYPAAPNGFPADIIACRCRLKFTEARRVR
jgi:hypothetical protein